MSRLQRFTTGAWPPLVALVIALTAVNLGRQHCGGAPEPDEIEAATRADTTLAAELAMAWFRVHATEGLGPQTLADWIAWSPATANLAPVRFASREALAPELARAHWGAMVALGHGVALDALEDRRTGHNVAQRAHLLCLLQEQDSEGSGRGAAGNASPAPYTDRVREAIAADTTMAPETAAWRALVAERDVTPDLVARSIAEGLREAGHEVDAQRWTRRAQRAEAAFHRHRDCPAPRQAPR